VIETVESGDTGDRNPFGSCGSPCSAPALRTATSQKTGRFEQAGLYAHFRQRQGEGQKFKS
jgi:hypothetical protein